MEKIGIERAVEELVSKGVKIKEIVTDGHQGIGLPMRECYSYLCSHFEKKI